MIPRATDWWPTLLLALAAFRVYRLISKDTITEPVRAEITYPDDSAVTLDQTEAKTWRIYLSTLVRCPWCVGFYVSVGWWLAWSFAPRWTLWLAVPWAVSALIGLLSKLDW